VDASSLPSHPETEGTPVASARERKEVYVDFGVRKPHAILYGESEQAVMSADLAGLGLKDCTVFLEEGCPRAELIRLVSNNRVLLVDGARVKARRDELGVPKSDVNDVRLVRELARSSPGVFREVTVREKAELANRMAYDYYCKLTTLIASLKNRQVAFLKEFGRELPELAAILRALETEKKKATKCFDVYRQAAKGLGIRGVGPRLLGGILLIARPARFHSMSAYLAYCGLKEVSIRSGKYSRSIRTLYHQLSTSVIMQGDAEFYRLYAQIKVDLRSRFPEDRPSRLEGRARNRLSTFLAKRIYLSFRES